MFGKRLQIRCTENDPPASFRTPKHRTQKQVSTLYTRLEVELHLLSAPEVPTVRWQNSIFLWVIKGVNNSLYYKIDHGATHIFVCKK